MVDSPNEFSAPSAPLPAATPTVEYATLAEFGGPPSTNGIAKVSIFFGVFCSALIGTALLMLFKNVMSENRYLILGTLVLATAIVALIAGIRALRRGRRGVVGGTGLAIAGISQGAMGLVATMFGAYMFFGASIGVSREPANRARCFRHLKVIGDAIQLYANENRGAYPPNLEALMLTQDISPDLFICPSSNDDPATGNTLEERAANLSKGHASYIYLGPVKNANTPTNFVLVYEPMTNHYQTGMHVLFADFHVELIAKPTAQKINAELQAGQNPPPSRQVNR